MLQCPCSPALTAPLSLPSVVSGDEPREKMELVTYFGKRPPGVLHCTTKFCDYGKAAGADEYAQQDVSAPRGHLAEVGRGQGLLEMGTGSRQGPQTRQPLRKRGSSIPSSPKPVWYPPGPAHQSLFHLQMRRECWLAAAPALASKPVFSSKG